jgi:hypothetical protein
LFEIRSDKRATFVCLGFKLWKANPVSFNLSIQCSKEVVCIEDLGELRDTFLFLLRRDPDATENSALPSDSSTSMDVKVAPDSGFSERTGCKLKPVRSSGGKLADDRRIGIFA